MEKTLPTLEVLNDTLRKTINTAWHLNSIHQHGINKWLDNFSGEALNDVLMDKEKARMREQQIALFLLCHFVYYNEDETKHMMRLMLEKYIHRILLLNEQMNPDDSNIDDIIKKTKFSHLGNESESSAYMLYLFRQINDLSKKDFSNKESVENIVFVDDFSITGSQAKRYLEKYIREHPDCKDKKIYVLLMVSTNEAVSNIKEISEVSEVLPCIVMDETSKAFSDSSIIFQGYPKELKDEARKMCEYYGERIKLEEEGSTALGFGGGGYLFGAYYNTPNNSLPIFWSEEKNWKPFFKRYNKRYTADSKIRLGGQYV